MNSGKLVTLGSLLLLIFSQILAVSPILMDMALQSFDDQYLGCREEMMEELEQGDYFQKEIAANKDYLRLWKKAQEALLKSPVGLLREMRDSHATALMAYTMNSSLHSQLNWATSTAGISPEHYRHNFSFKYFHFYLTTAIQILKEWQSSMGEHQCYQVHRGVKDLYIKAKEGSRVRFGRFTSTSHLRSEARKFGNETLFTVTTCLGAAMQGFSYHTSEKEVLIPPYEIFLVKSFLQTQQGNRLHLHSVGNYSKYQCQLVEDNPKRKQELIHLHQELLDSMSTNFHATNELVGVLNEHLGCTITPIEMRESSTVKENCEIIIQVMSEIQHQVQKIDSDMKDKLEPVLYQKLYDIKEPELEKIAIAQRVFSIIFGEATSTAAMVAIKLLGSDHLTLTVSKLIGVLAQIGASVLGGVSITIIGLGLEMILHAILGAVERSQLLTAVRSYEKHLAEFKAASEKYQRAIHEVTSLVRQQVQ